MNERTFVRNLVQRLPDTVRVGAYDLTIEKWDQMTGDNHDKYGTFSSVDQRISIRTDLVTRYRVVEVFLHEATHAMWWVASLPEDDEKVDQEQIVAQLGQAQMALYRDNPWLLDWIKSAKL